MNYNFELKETDYNFYLNTPSTNHLQFRKFTSKSIYTIEEVKSLIKELKNIAKNIRAEYNIKVTLKGLDKAILEFENMYKRYTTAIQSVNEKYEEALAFAKKYDNIPFCQEKSKELSEYSINLQKDYNHYFYRTGAISICNNIVEKIENAISDFKFLKMNMDNGAKYLSVSKTF